MNVCSIENCDKPTIGRGWCRRHYDKWYKNGDPNYRRPIGITSLYYDEYRIWRGMKVRCDNIKCPMYKHYGGRGIKICKRWYNFANFIQDMGKRPSKHAIRYTLDRIDVNGNYEPSNCRWTTYTEQIRNRRPSHLNKTGYVGVSWDKQKNKWRADIKTELKQKLIGRYTTLNEAVEARRVAEQLYWT